MNIMDEFKKSFTPCKHKNKTYLGIQETTNPDVFLILYNCDDCHSTITEPSKTKIQGFWEIK